MKRRTLLKAPVLGLAAVALPAVALAASAKDQVLKITAPWIPVSTWRKPPSFDQIVQGYGCKLTNLIRTRSLKGYSQELLIEIQQPGAAFHLLWPPEAAGYLLVPTIIRVKQAWKRKVLNNV